MSEEFTSIGKPFWREAGVEHKIRLTIAPAAETLAKLVEAGEENTFDFAFIDADKVSAVQCVMSSHSVHNSEFSAMLK